MASSTASSNYYGGSKYFNGSNDHNQYGSFSSNRKHFQQKLMSKSTSSLFAPPPRNGNTFYPEYSHHPSYNNLLFQDDMSLTSHENDSLDEDLDGVQVDSNSNFSFATVSSAQDGQEGDIATQKTKENSHSHPLLGMLLVMCSAIFYAALNLSVKWLMDETPWQELMIIRMGITWLATLVWMLVRYKGKMHLCGPSKQRCLLSVRAFFLWAAMFTCWWSFEFLPVGDGTTLQMSFPVFVSIFAHFVWRRRDVRLDLFGWICVLAGLLGIAFIAQPSFIFGVTEDNDTSHRDLGITIGLISSFCAGIQYVIVNYTKEDCHWLQVEQMTAGLSTFVLCPLGALAFALYDFGEGGLFRIGWEGLSVSRWAQEIGLGLLGFVALALLTRGSQLDAPARTAICLYLEIPFVYIGQSIMTQSLPDVYIFIGIILVLCSVVIPACRKLRASKRERQLKKRVAEDETVPLIANQDLRNMISGVTVEWTSEEDSAEIH